MPLAIKRGVRTLETKGGHSTLRVSTPANLDLALEGLVRKVLREQPKQEDIYKFAADYFENLLDIRDKAEDAENANPSEICPESTEIEGNELIKLAMSFPKPSFLLTSPSKESRLPQTENFTESNNEESNISVEQAADTIVVGENDSESKNEENIVSNKQAADSLEANDDVAAISEATEDNEMEVLVNVDNKETLQSEEDGDLSTGNDVADGGKDEDENALENNPGADVGTESEETMSKSLVDDASNSNEDNEEQMRSEDDKATESDNGSLNKENEDAIKSTDVVDEAETGDSMRDEMEGCEVNGNAARDGDQMTNVEVTPEDLETENSDIINHNGDKRNEDDKFIECEASEVSDMSKTGVNEAFIASELDAPLEDGTDQPERDIIREFIENEKQYCTQGNSTVSIEVAEVYEAPLSISSDNNDHQHEVAEQVQSTKLEVVEDVAKTHSSVIAAGIGSLSNTTDNAEGNDVGIVGGVEIENHEDDTLEESPASVLESEGAGLIGGVTILPAANDNNMTGDDGDVNGEVLRPENDNGDNVEVVDVENLTECNSEQSQASLLDADKVGSTVGFHENSDSNIEPISLEGENGGVSGTLEMENNEDSNIARHLEISNLELEGAKAGDAMGSIGDKEAEHENNASGTVESSESIVNEEHDYGNSSRKKRDLSDQMENPADKSEDVLSESAENYEKYDVKPEKENKSENAMDTSESILNDDGNEDGTIDMDLAQAPTTLDGFGPEIETALEQVISNDEDREVVNSSPTTDGTNSVTDVTSTTGPNNTIDQNEECNENIEIPPQELENSEIKSEAENDQQTLEQSPKTAQKSVNESNHDNISMTSETEETVVTVSNENRDESDSLEKNTEQKQLDGTTEENGASADSLQETSSAQLENVMQAAESAVDDIVKKVEISTTEAATDNESSKWAATEKISEQSRNDRSDEGTEEGPEDALSNNGSLDNARSRSSKDSESLDADENPFISAEVTTLVESEVAEGDEGKKENEGEEAENKDDENDVIVPLNAVIDTIEEQDEGTFAAQAGTLQAATVIQKNYRKYLGRKHATENDKAETDNSENQVIEEGEATATIMDSTSTDSATLSSSATKIQNKRMEFAESTLETSQSFCESASTQSSSKKTGMSPRQNAVDSEVWNTLEKELDTAATKIQNSFRDYRSRKRLRREDAVQITTTASEESTESTTWSKLEGTGELHDTIIPEEINNKP